MEPLADDETLGGAGVAQNGSAELDVLLADLTAAEAAELGSKVWPLGEVYESDVSIVSHACRHYITHAPVAWLAIRVVFSLPWSLQLHAALEQGRFRFSVSIQPRQLLEAADAGRAEDMIELLAEGANIEFKSQARVERIAMNLFRIFSRV